MLNNAVCVSTYKRKDLLKRNPIQLAAIVYWAISSVIKRPKTALICGNKQSMAAKFALQSGFDSINVLPKHLLQQHGYWLYDRAVALGYEPGILANVSRNTVLVAKVVAGFNDLGKPPLLIKQRTIDEQYSGLNQLDWLHIQDASAHLLLVGAMNLINRDKPIITLNNLANSAAKKAAMTVLSQCAYQCFDYTLTPIDLNEQAIDGIPCAWICIHQNDDALKRISELTRFDAELALGSQLETDIMKPYYKSLVSYNTRATNVLSAYLFRTSEAIDIDVHLQKDFYAKEHNTDDTWNWSGPSSESKILLAIESPGHYCFTASIFSLPEKVSSMPLYIFVDGQLCASVVISSGCELEFDFTALPSSCRSGVEVLFCIEKTTPVEGKDLGFSLGNIKLSYQESKLQ